MNTDTQSQPCAFCNVTKSISEWMAHPFDTQGSAFHWILFVGLLIVAVWFWQVILLMLLKDVEG